MRIAAYQFGWVGSDPPVAFPLLYHALRLCQFDLASGAATGVSGVNSGAQIPLRHVSDYSSVISTGGGPAFVLRRGDGCFWLGNGEEI